MKIEDLTVGLCLVAFLTALVIIEQAAFDWPRCFFEKRMYDTQGMEIRKYQCTDGSQYYKTVSNINRD